MADSQGDVSTAVGRAILAGRRVAPLARRRYQNGQLIKDGDRWVGRWREDVRLPDDTIKRVRRKEILASTADTTKRMAQRLLDDRLRDINSPDYRPAPAENF